MLQRMLREALRRRGWELKRIGAPVRGFEHFMTSLQQVGFAPGTVIDIGVATGTPWLHGKFPSARLVLIEPNPRFASDLHRLATTWNADVYPHAVGTEEGELVLHEDSETPSDSSVLAVSSLLKQYRDRTGDTRTYNDIRVRVRTLDDTLGDRYAGPYLLKIDAEGFERDIFLGASRTLVDTAMVIVEASVAPRFEHAYDFADLVGLLDSKGFRLFDILDIKTFRLGGGAINYMDVAFIHRDCKISLVPSA